ncbi:lipase [Williamsia deligens]|nr:lipase [Williamsia deligens]
MAVTTFGPADGETVLVVHGVTGHGRRWRPLAEDHLADLRIVAPDLLGHGHSSWEAPWTIERQVAGLLEVLDRDVDGPVVVVGHSYGGALALHLSATAPDRVRGLVLLDPAVDLDGDRMADAAASTLDSWYVRDEQDAWDRKRAESWWEVDDAVLTEEIETHLLPTADGRMTWRLHPGAIMTTWSELARPFALPPAGTETAMIVADKVQPPYASAGFVAALTDRLGDSLTIHHEDCDHMVPLSRPELTAATIRDVLARTA